MRLIRVKTGNGISCQTEIVPPIMVEQLVGEVVEEVRLFRAEKSRVDLVDGLPQLGVGFIVLAGNIATERRQPPG